MKRLLIALLFVISLTSFSTMVNLPIKSVEVVNNQQVPASLIKETLKLKEGAKFSTEALLADFNALKETGYFEDVILQPISYDGGVRIVVDVVEKENVVDLLKEKGVAVNTLREDTDKSIVISSVKFTGNSRVTTAELLDITQLKAGEYFSRSRVEDAQRRLLATGKFSEVRPDAQVSNGKMALSFEVAENPIVKSIVITGNHTIPTSTIMSALTTKPGSVQNYNNLREDRDKILGLYQAQGYTLVNITDMSTDENGTLHISIVEGIVRKIEVKKMVTKQKGNRRTPNDDVLKTKDYVIDREIEIQPGKIFNVKEYDATVDNLMRLGIFKNVKYEARSIPGDPEGIDLILLIDEDRTAELQGGVAYGSESGLMGTLSLKDSNWRGKNQQFGFTFEKSNKDYTGFALDFYDPWIKDTDRVSWGWGAYKTSYGDEDSILFHEIDTIGFKVNIGKGLSKNFTLSLGTKVEYIKEAHEDGKLRKANNGKWYYNEKNKWREIEGVDDKYWLWSIYPYISYDTRNNYLNPTSGLYAKWQIEGGHAGGYKSGNFGNTTLELRTYHKGLFKNNTFAYKVVGGVATNNTKESQKFWVGGGNSLRGYDGGFFKGSQKLVATIENRTQLNDIIGIVVFADAGRAWKQNGRDPSYTRDNNRFGHNIGTTAGVGIRLNTPIGPLRFDFGWPVGNKMDDDGMKFYFNMGQSF
ncbi:Omp85 [Fusobacterium polymorphum]|uniref:OmpIP family outer membrane porin n=1 Tax=Fusobacterium polymorphum ATCC 10953 TaxID=393480 RepID=A5TRR3_FUSNP|nr:outer membrane protein assembly factor [Fusobacterium polymorphum]EDK87588.1 OmpIP family outer membrane porin [Fusobacterium polymorphum ATCC 10953]UTI52895.1 outer membrane protein assembly factor [Fusobacterium polymorphum]WRL67412.1 outer membrane protein assembly factor [Fusobacterium polymorphum]CKH16015.1 Omp85 [Fusobacterium polymorphum]